MPGALQENQWVVQKYGGTSLGKLLDTITSNIIPKYLKTTRVAVVCSALSGTTKSLGTTSLLLQAIDNAVGSSRSEEALKRTINTIKEEHIKACRLALASGATKNKDQLLVEIELQIVDECNQLYCFLAAAQGIKAEFVSLLDIITKAYTSNLYKQKEAYDRLGSRFFDSLAIEIGHMLRACEDRVPVITGFFGMMPYSLLQSVGRGYSDLCAALCAAGISATELQIWKEVDGIFTADPRKIPSARLLATVTLEEASELTYYGSEVIHPLTMEQIRNAKIPLRIKNVKNPNGSGTIIYPHQNYNRNTDSLPSSLASSVESLASLVDGVSSFMSANGYYGEDRNRRTPTALTTKDSIILMNIVSLRQTKSHGFLAQVFAKLDELHVVADLITSSEQSVSVALASLDEALKIDRLILSLEKIGKIEILENMSIVSVIGHKMRNMVGIAGQIFSELAKGGVNIYLIGQGASEINISFVVKDVDAQLAMNLVHANVLGIPQYTGSPWLY
ncbi:hypothetical protein B7463_g5523, partial [Scytalidium lignicola]